MNKSAKALKTSALREATAALQPYADKPLKAAFLARGVRALTELADRLRPSELQAAIAGETRASTLLLALTQPGAVGLVRPDVDPLARARLRGVERREQLLSAEGGTIPTDAVTKHLGISLQAVHKRRTAGKLIGFELGRRGMRFPAWQFTDDGVVDGLESVLEALDDAPPLAILRFFLSGNERLGGERPLDVLRQRRVEPVVAAARAFGNHGAP